LVLFSIFSSILFCCLPHTNHFLPIFSSILPPSHARAVNECVAFAREAAKVATPPPYQRKANGVMVINPKTFPGTLKNKTNDEAWQCVRIGFHPRRWPSVDTAVFPPFAAP
jgi:hypothetical protein